MENVKEKVKTHWRPVLSAALEGTSIICGILTLCSVPGAAIAGAATELLKGVVVQTGGDGDQDGDGSTLLSDQMSNLSMEQQKYFDEMKGLVGQMTVEQKDQFAGMKGIVREMTDEQRRQHTELKGQVGALYDTVKSGFQIIEGSVSKTIGELKSVQKDLLQQRKMTTIILEIVQETRYMTGIERIEAAYKTMIKGSSNMKPSLERLGGFIFELETDNEQHLNIEKVKKYLDLVREQSGREKAVELGFYILTVKAEFLLLVSLYYTSNEEYKRVTMEYEEFNRDAMQIIKYAGLADIYEGEYLNGLKHGKGTMFYKSGVKYEGNWSNDVEHGHGKLVLSDGTSYVGNFKNGVEHGAGHKIWASGAEYEGKWLNGARHGSGKNTYKNSYPDEEGWVNENWFDEEMNIFTHTYVGEYFNDSRQGIGQITFGNENIYDGEWVKDKMHGKGVYKWASGDSYSGHYAYDVKHGSGEYKWNNGRSYNGLWEDGVPHGSGVFRNRNAIGETEKQEWIKGVLQ